MRKGRILKVSQQGAAPVGVSLATTATWAAR